MTRKHFIQQATYYELAGSSLDAAQLLEQDKQELF